MITRLTGILESMDPPQATVGVPGGLAYEVLVPSYLAESLRAKVGQSITLMTLQYLESPNQGSTFVPRLIGFRTAQDRRFFELFTTVKGIGNRKALRAMAREPGVIARAIEAKDTRSLTELPEIGKRLAETIIVDLGGKVGAFLSGEERDALDRAAEIKHASVGGAAEDTIGALMALGESRSDAEAMVAQARRRAGPDAKTEDLLALAISGRGR